LFGILVLLAGSSSVTQAREDPHSGHHDQNSGHRAAGFLIPIFEKDGLFVKTIAVGSGKP